MVHPEVKKFYDKHGLDYIQSAHDRKETWFEATTKGHEHNIHIPQIFRSRVGALNSKEFIYFFEEDNSLDFKGNDIQMFRIRGKYDMPKGEFKFDEKSGESVCTGISKHETIYEIPFDKKQIEKWVNDGIIDGKTKFILDYSGRLYGEIEYDDFVGLSFDDLLYVCRTGLRPEQKLSEVRKKADKSD